MFLKSWLSNFRCRIQRRTRRPRTRRQSARSSCVTAQVQVLETRDLLSGVLTNTMPTVSLKVLEGAPTGNVVLATFTDGDPSAAQSGFTLNVNAGGALIGPSSASVQLVSRSATASTWEVLGNATYATQGTKTATVAVADDHGGSFVTG